MIVDRIASSYIKHILLPKILKIDNPGFILEDFRPIGRDTLLRVIFMPETFMIYLEDRLKPKLLYIIGKKFGYYYSQLSNLPNIVEEPDRKRLSDFIYFYVKFVEGTQSGGLTCKFDLDEKLFQLRMKNYIVCSKNGKGFFLPLGGVAGIWAWIMQDPEIEAVQPYCQGRNNKNCLVIAAPYETLKKMRYKPIRFTKLEGIKIGHTYNILNKVKSTKWSTVSLKNMIDGDILKYRYGIATYKGERFFLCGLELIYILEKELQKVKNGLKILWNVSFDFGKRLSNISGKQDPCKFIMDFFPALGFGDILVLEKKGKYEVYVNYFPWLEWWKEIDFTMFRGMLSGVISGFTGKKIMLKEIEKDTSAGYLSLVISE